MNFFLVFFLYCAVTHTMDESNITCSQELQKQTNHYNELLKKTRDKDNLLRDLIEKEEHHFIEAAIDNTRLKHIRSFNKEELINKIKNAQRACLLHANLLYRLRGLLKQEREPLYGIVKKSETKDPRSEQGEHEKTLIERNLIESAMNILRIEHELSKNNETHNIVSAFISQIKKDYKEGALYTQFFHKDNFQSIAPNDRISQLHSNYSLISDKSITLIIKGALSHHESYDKKIGESVNAAYKEHYFKEHVRLFTNTHLKGEKITSLVNYTTKTLQLEFDIVYVPEYKEDCIKAMHINKSDCTEYADLLCRLRDHGLMKLTENKDQNIQQDAPVIGYNIKRQNEPEDLPAASCKKAKKNGDNGDNKTPEEK